MNLREKTYLSFFIFSILIFVMLFFIIFPLFSNIKKSSKEFFFQREKIDSLEEKIKNLRELNASYKKISSEIEKTNDLFVDASMPINFITFLEKVAQETNNKIEISPLDKSAKKEYFWKPLFFNLKIQGLFSNFSKFLEKLENAPYLLEIEELRIEKGKTADLKGNEIEAFISFKVFSK